MVDEDEEGCARDEGLRSLLEDGEELLAEGEGLRLVCDVAQLAEQAALGHRARGDLEHDALPSGEEIDDVAGEVATVVVLGLDTLPVGCDPLCRSCWLEGEDRLDLGQGQGDAAQQGDEMRPLELGELVGAIAGVGVDGGRLQQTEFLVEAQGLGRKSRAGAELTDAEPLHEPLPSRFLLAWRLWTLPQGQGQAPDLLRAATFRRNRQDQRRSCIEAALERQSDRVGDRVGGRWLFAGRNVVIVTTLVEAAGIEPASTDAQAESLQA